MSATIIAIGGVVPVLILGHFGQTTLQAIVLGVQLAALLVQFGVIVK